MQKSSDSIIGIGIGLRVVVAIAVVAVHVPSIGTIILTTRPQPVANNSKDSNN